MMKKNVILRDTLFVAPVFLFTATWIILKLCFHIDFAPGADYAKSMYMNLIIPFAMIGLGQIAYGIVLIADIVRTDKYDTKKKVLYSVVVCFAVQILNLYFLVYIIRIFWLLNHKDPVNCNS